MGVMAVYRNFSSPRVQVVWSFYATNGVVTYGMSHDFVLPFGPVPKINNLTIVF